MRGKRSGWFVFGVLIGVTVLTAATLTVFDPARAGAANTSAACTVLAVEAATRGVTNDELLAAIGAKCQAGDILQIPNGYIGVMAQVCDFTRTIWADPVRNSPIMCVFAGRRSVRQ